MEKQRIIAVSVGLIFDAGGRVLMGRRPEHKSYPLQWEFPGGKVETGETSVEGLRRELREELGIISADERLHHTETTTYSDGRTYRVEYFAINAWEGTIRNREFAGIAWVHPADFGEYEILEGNRRICARLVEEKGSSCQ